MLCRIGRCVWMRCVLHFPRRQRAETLSKLTVATANFPLLSCLVLKFPLEGRCSRRQKSLAAHLIIADASRTSVPLHLAAGPHLPSEKSHSDALLQPRSCTWSHTIERLSWSKTHQSCADRHAGREKKARMTRRRDEGPRYPKECAGRR